MMILTDLIKRQMFECVVMFASGIGLGALYSLFVFCKNVAVSSDDGGKRIMVKLTAALEIAFWIFAAVYITGFIGYAAFGALSVHGFLMMFLGALLWRRLFYGKIKN